MRLSDLFPIVAAGLVAFVIAMGVIVAPDFATASDGRAPRRAPATIAPPLGLRGTTIVEPANRTPLDETDEVAALESVHYALTQVGDGASYVWHRNNGRLSGLVQPVGSFKDERGLVCRHFVVILTAGLRSRKAEGVACRMASGQWTLEG